MKNKLTYIGVIALWFASATFAAAKSSINRLEVSANGDKTTVFIFADKKNGLINELHEALSKAGLKAEPGLVSGITRFTLKATSFSVQADESESSHTTPQVYPPRSIMAFLEPGDFGLYLDREKKGNDVLSLYHSETVEELTLALEKGGVPTENSEGPAGKGKKVTGKNVTCHLNVGISKNPRDMTFCHLTLP